MVTWVRGHFKNVHGTVEFNPEDPHQSSVEVVIQAKELWTGDLDRDSHLKSADFLDVENHPTITFRSTRVEQMGCYDYRVTGDLLIHGVTRSVALDVSYLGQWRTPWWEAGMDKGPVSRAGFLATTRINRHDFGIGWNGKLERDGVVVSPEIVITVDAEAILEKAY